MSQEIIEKLREELDLLNLQILDLISKRAAISLEIGNLKAKQGVPRYDPERERIMLDKIIVNNQGPFDNQTIRHLFKQIFQASLDLQEDARKKVLLVSRKKQKEDTVVTLGEKIKIGNGEPVVIAGPCSVESYEQTKAVARLLKEEGVTIMRGGAFKPRTSPYDFQGLGMEGLRILKEVADEYDLKVISEIVNPNDIEKALPYVDVIQIGARNMQNFELLKKAGQVDKPVLLKRGLAATMEELLLAAEYILSQGNKKVILTERGIRTYEKETRNTLDISAVPILKQESHLPVLVDISHSTGRRDIVIPIAKAALAVGADGIMVEVHPNPAVALSDAQQQLNLLQFKELMKALREANMLKRLIPQAK